MGTTTQPPTSPPPSAPAPITSSAASSTPDRLRTLGRIALGSRRDWTIPLPDPAKLRPGVALLGPLAMVASTVVGWWAFAGATGEDGNVALGLFVGAASIVLMAWSFVLAVRAKVLEPLFGGLDRAYQAHRWAGTLSVLLMFLHVRIEPEIDGGIRGASEAMADTAEVLAGVGEYMIYGLVAASLIRWFPYRWWRLTHKLLGIPFAFASWHFITAEKTYANNSPWGWYFGSIMAVGLLAYLWRVVALDMVAQGKRYEVVGADVEGTTLDLRLAPKGRPLTHKAGQFAVLKIQERGLSEPHIFTIASSPDSEHLRFFIRSLGDWSDRLLTEDLVGSTVLVEGPYGTFEPLPHDDRPVWWVAGGVGITPFLSAIDGLAPAPEDHRPTLLYCVRRSADATAIAELERAAVEGRINLEMLASAEGRRFSPELFADLAGERLQGAHVAVCGPAGLVRDVSRTARANGATEVESEAFDIRSGVGPDLSKPIDDLMRGDGEKGAESSPAATPSAAVAPAPAPGG